MATQFCHFTERKKNTFNRSSLDKICIKSLRINHKKIGNKKEEKNKFTVYCTFSDFRNFHTVGLPKKKGSTTIGCVHTNFHREKKYYCRF